MSKIGNVHNQHLATVQQTRLWYFHELAPEQTHTHFDIYLQFQSSLTLKNIQDAIKQFTATQPALSVIFLFQDGKVVQRHDPDISHTIKIIDLSNLPKTQQTQQLNRHIKMNRHTAIDIEHEAPLFFTVFQLDEITKIIGITAHHIIWDSVSSQLFRDYFVRYLLFDEKTHNEGAIDLDYFEYIDLQEKSTDSLTTPELLREWQTLINNNPPLINFPLDHLRAHHHHYQQGRYEFDLTAELSSKIRDVTQLLAISELALFCSALLLLCHIYSRDKVISLGIPVDDRTQFDMDHTIGCLTKHLVIHHVFEPSETMNDMHATLRQQITDKLAQPNNRFENVIGHLDLSHDTNYHPLFQLSCCVTNPPLDTGQGNNNTLQCIDHKDSVLDLDLALIMTRSDDGYSGKFLYNMRIFESTTLNRIATHLNRILEFFTKDTSTSMTEMNLVSPEEHQYFTYEIPRKLIIDSPKFYWCH